MLVDAIALVEQQLIFPPVVFVRDLLPLHAAVGRAQHVVRTRRDEERPVAGEAADVLGPLDVDPRPARGVERLYAERQEEICVVLDMQRIRRGAVRTPPGAGDWNCAQREGRQSRATIASIKSG